MTDCNPRPWLRIVTGSGVHSSAVGMVPADDPDAAALLQAVGADPAVVLAPERP